MSDTIIDRKQAKAMVEKYQASPLGGIDPKTGQPQPLTRFVHFTLAQFFELLSMNNIVSYSDTVESVLENKSNFGIKLYFAQHVDVSDCPNNDVAYIGSNTIVMVNTLQKNAIWYDIPELNSGIIEIQEYETADSGKAVDKGSKCPPECNPFSNNL